MILLNKTKKDWDRGRGTIRKEGKRGVWEGHGARQMVSAWSSPMMVAKMHFKYTDSASTLLALLKCNSASGVLFITEHLALGFTYSRHLYIYWTETLLCFFFLQVFIKLTIPTKTSCELLFFSFPFFPSSYGRHLYSTSAPHTSHTSISNSLDWSKLIIYPTILLPSIFKLLLLIPSNIPLEH